MTQIEILTNDSIINSLTNNLKTEKLSIHTDSELAIAINITSYKEYPNTYWIIIQKKNNTFGGVIDRDKAKNIIANCGIKGIYRNF